LSNCQTKEFIENIQLASIAVLRAYFCADVNETHPISKKCSNCESLRIMYELLQSFYVPGDYAQICDGRLSYSVH
jgi:hypothetical protein